MEKEAKKVAAIIKSRLNLDTLKHFALMFTIAIGVVLVGATSWFCLGEIFPGLRNEMPNFFNFIDGILKGFDALYSIFQM